MQPQDSYLTSRAEALHNVESTITELGGIFQQLAHMVSAVLTASMSMSCCLLEAFAELERSGSHGAAELRSG